MRTPVRDRWQVTLPQEVREALHVQPGDDIEFDIDEEGVVRVRGLKSIPADQVWFWTEKRQVGEREAEEDIAAGRVTQFDSDEDFLASLRSDLRNP